MSKNHQSHAHHYVPQWYQHRFLPVGQANFYYLDLRPETIVWNGGSHTRKAMRRLGPGACFYKDNLYTLRFGKQTTDGMERFFFGDIDTKGHNAVVELSKFEGISKGALDSFQHLAGYVGAQRFRTPRGLEDIKLRATREDASHNAILAALARVFQIYSTMWTEGVWEIVRAGQSSTKFIVTDNPVTLYCKVMFPSDWNYPADCNLKQIGSRTLFPLGLDACLIITHLQLCRNPWNTPTEHRANARYYDQALKHLGDIQFGRELDEDEVLRINYILKTRATRHVAAAEENWLYPEQYVSIREWKNLDDDWFLLPHLWEVPFTTGISVGYRDGGAWAADEYGRHPGNPGFEDKRMRERDHATFERAKLEWAKKRVGKSLAQTDEYRQGHGTDRRMAEYLQRERLLPNIEESKSEVKQSGNRHRTA